MQWEAGLVAAHHLLERTPMCRAGELNDDWLPVHAGFHLALVSGAGNRRMLEITRRLREEADLYRRWYLAGQDLQRSQEQVAAEHRELLDASLAREASTAGALMRQQLRRATNTWLNSASVRASA